MRPRRVLWSAVLAATMGGATPSLAQEGHEESFTVASGVDARAMAEDWIILPSGESALGGNLRFLTAEGGLGEGPLRFTDVLLLDMNGRRSLGGWGEVFGSVTLLPKQPSRTNELLWQGAQLGGRVGFADRYAASLRAAVGPTLARSGNWMTAELAVEGRKSLHRTLRLQGVLGASATALRLGGESERRLGFGEIVTDGEVVFQWPWFKVAMWMGTQLRFPVAAFASPASARETLNPQTRVNFRLGAVLAYIDDWDLFAEWAVTDRGELSVPSTTLPILDGGFDQTTLSIGLTRRFSRSW